MWKALREDGVYAAPNFGVFTVKAGRVSFLQKNFKIASGDFFGLNEFYFPVLDKSHRKHSAASGHFSSSSVKTLAAGAAAAVVLLFVGQPINDASQPDMASVVPMRVSQASLEKELNVKSMELNQVRSELDSYREAVDGYYLIVADFPDEESAASYLHKAKNKSLTLLGIDQRFYVSAFSAKSKEDVLAYRNMSEEIGENSYVLSVSKFNNELK